MAGHKSSSPKEPYAGQDLYEEDGKIDTNYAQVVSDLGLFYQSTGRFVKAKNFR